MLLFIASGVDIDAMLSNHHEPNVLCVHRRVSKIGISFILDSESLRIPNQTLFTLKNEDKQGANQVN